MVTRVLHEVRSWLSWSPNFFEAGAVDLPAANRSMVYNLRSVEIFLLLVMVAVRGRKAVDVGV